MFKLLKRSEINIGQITDALSYTYMDMLRLRTIVACSFENKSGNILEITNPPDLKVDDEADVRRFMSEVSELLDDRQMGDDSYFAAFVSELPTLLDDNKIEDQSDFLKFVSELPELLSDRIRTDSLLSSVLVLEQQSESCSIVGKRKSVAVLPTVFSKQARQPDAIVVNTEPEESRLSML